MAGQLKGSRADLFFPADVWVIFSIALLLRLAFFFHQQGSGSPFHYDGELYLALAEGLEHGVFSMFHPLDIPETTRMPGYPFLIHLLGSPKAVLLLQVFLSACKVPLLFLIGREFGLKSFPIMSAALLMIAIEPIDIILSASLLTESLFTFLLLVGILFGIRRGSWLNVLVAALAFSAAAYLRPNGLHIAIIVSAFLFFRSPIHRKKAIALFILLIALLLPWALRNYSIDGRFHLSDSGVVVSAHFHVPEVLALADPSKAIHHREQLHLLAEQTNWTDRRAFRSYFETIGIDVRRTFKDHPVQSLAVQSKKAAHILAAPGRGHINMFFDRSTIVYSGIVFLSIAFSVLIVGICVMTLLQWRKLKWEQLLLIAIIFFLIFSAAISTADARFKDPAIPLLILLGAWALHNFRSRVTDHRSR